MLSRLLSILCFLLLLQPAIAQRHCGFDQYNKQQRNYNPQLFEEALNKRLRTVGTNHDSSLYIIPVVVHIIHNNSNGTIGGANNSNITDAQVISQIQVLNEDFRRMSGSNGYNDHPDGADVRMEFCLATTDPEGNPTTGIVRKYNAKAAWGMNEDAQLKKLSYWNSKHYLNIWVTRLADKVIGYAQFPNNSGLPGVPNDDNEKTDGVVINFSSFGTKGYVTAPYHLGRTTTHEVGHWLGLLHIWGDGKCQTDYVDDTPTQKEETSGADCLINYSYCSGSPTRDMIENYLDYSADKCMNIFTKGQKERMRTAFEISRNELVNSIGCCNEVSFNSFPYTDNFESGLNPDQWKVTNTNKDNTWEEYSDGGFGRSSSSIKLDNQGQYSSFNKSFIDVLETPYMNMKESYNPVLEFSYAYAGNANQKTDSIVIMYNYSCKENYWNHLTTLTGADLITTSKTDANFSPAAGDWKKFRTDLSPLKGKVMGRIKIISYSKIGHNFYLDDFSVFNLSNTLTINIYPNPAAETINVHANFKETENLDFYVYDILGKQVYHSLETNQTAFTKSINVSNLDTGIYILTVVSDNEKATKRFLKY